MSSLTLSAAQTLRLRSIAQGLTDLGSADVDKPDRVVRDLLGVQAQDLPAARLSIRARSTGLTADDVEQARVVERSILWTWCLRGTLHLMTADDAKWLIPLLAADFIAADQRRFEELGWNETSSRRAIDLLQQALTDQKELTRQQITHLLAKNGFPSEGQAPVHLLYRAAWQGVLGLGVERGNKPTYVLLEAWLGELQPLPRAEALNRLARRYLAAYAPATPHDFAGWSGLKLSECRRAWENLAGELVEVEAAGQPAWMLAEQLPWVEASAGLAPLVRLLPKFDTYWLGYSSRDLCITPAFARQLHPGGGIIRQALLIDGQARGTWKVTRRRSGLQILVEPFTPVSKTIQAALELEVADLGRFLGEATKLVLA